MTEFPGSYPAVHTARHALQALYYLEVPSVIVDDVKAKVEAAFKEILDDRQKAIEMLMLKYNPPQEEPNKVNSTNS